MRQAHELNYFGQTGLIETQKYKKKTPDLTIVHQILNPCLFLKMCRLFVLIFIQKNQHSFFFIYVMGWGESLGY